MKFELIPEAKRWYAMYSVWFFAILGLTPDLYNLAVQFQLITAGDAPPELARLINLIAFLGAASRLIRQSAVSGQIEQRTPVSPESLKD